MKGTGIELHCIREAEQRRWKDKMRR